MGCPVQFGVDLTQYDISPTITWQTGGGWRVRLLGDYGWSKTAQRIPGINTAAEAAALRGTGLTRDTALNPYDLTATSPGVIGAISDWQSYAYNIQTLAQARGFPGNCAFGARRARFKRRPARGAAFSADRVDVFGGVEEAAVQPDLEVHVYARGAARAAHLRHDVPGLHGERRR